MQAATTGKRIAAFAIDFGIIIIAKSVLLPSGKKQFLVALVFALYTALMEASKYRATLGKMALGLETLGADGAPINWKMSFLRGIIRGVSLPISPIFMIPFLVSSYFVFFTDDKRTLHDRAAKTQVVFSAG